MSDLSFKLKVLYWMVSSEVHSWYREVWKRDLDEHYCCDGRECSCGGESVRDVWSLVAHEAVTQYSGAEE